MIIILLNLAKTMDACATAAASQVVDLHYKFLLMCFGLCWIFIGLFVWANFKREKALMRVLTAIETCHAFHDLEAEEDEVEEDMVDAESNT